MIQDDGRQQIFALYKDVVPFIVRDTLRHGGIFSHCGGQALAVIALTFFSRDLDLLTFNRNKANVSVRQMCSIYVPNTKFILTVINSLLEPTH